MCPGSQLFVSNIALHAIHITTEKAVKIFAGLEMIILDIIVVRP